MKRILFLVSGNGGTLKVVNEAIRANRFNFEVVAVIADRECGALDYAEETGIDNRKVVITKGEQTELARLITSIEPDIVITNVHRILHKNVITLPNIKFINLHYSLLPAYAGLIGMETIKRAKKDNACFIGATTHEVIEEVDEGKILGQCIITTDWKKRKAEDYYGKVFRGASLVLLNQLVAMSQTEDKAKITEQYDGIIFNPPLSFNLKSFDGYFWGKISKL